MWVSSIHHAIFLFICRESVMKYIFPALPVLLALVFLTGCPQSGTPDKPPLVPQPKASLSPTGLL